MGCRIKTRIGGDYFNNKGEYFTVVDYISVNNCTVQFEDGTIVKNIFFNTIKKGSIKNPNSPSVYGLGYFGQGLYKNNKKVYSAWISMFQRCYEKAYQNRCMTYIGCSVVEEWHNFQNFAQWFAENYKPEYMKGWCLDKDILMKGNKVYSSETCCFVPIEINNLFTKGNIRRGETPIGVSITKYGKYSAIHRQVRLGNFGTAEEAFQVYKEAKETYIKEVADKWKNQITEETYNALISYKVEITD